MPEACRGPLERRPRRQHVVNGNMGCARTVRTAEAMAGGTGRNVYEVSSAATLHRRGRRRQTILERPCARTEPPCGPLVGPAKPGRPSHLKRTLTNPCSRGLDKRKCLTLRYEPRDTRGFRFTMTHTTMLYGHWICQAPAMEEASFEKKEESLLKPVPKPDEVCAKAAGYVSL